MPLAFLFQFSYFFSTSFIPAFLFFISFFIASFISPFLPLFLFFNFFLVQHFPSFVFLSLYFFKSLFDLSLLYLFALKFSVLQCNCMFCLLLHLSEHASACLQPERFEMPRWSVLAYSDLDFGLLLLQASGPIHPTRAWISEKTVLRIRNTLLSQQCVNSGQSDPTQTKKQTRFNPCLRVKGPGMIFCRNTGFSAKQRKEYAVLRSDWASV
jgi:hypothetical protein